MNQRHINEKSTSKQRRLSVLRLWWEALKKDYFPINTKMCILRIKNNNYSIIICGTANCIMIQQQSVMIKFFIFNLYIIPAIRDRF